MAGNAPGADSGEKIIIKISRAGLRDPELADPDFRAPARLRDRVVRRAQFPLNSLIKVPAAADLN